MKLRRSLTRWTATLAVACCAFGTLATAAHASTPPSDPPGSTTETTVEGGSAGGSPEATGQIEESWAVTPASSADVDAAGNRSEFAYEAQPGTVINDAVTVFNLGNVPEDFFVYPTDAFTTDEGKFDLLPGNDTPVDIGAWVGLVQNRIRLQPGEQATIPVTITVPIDARPGDHAGAIVASAPTKSIDEKGNTIELDRRTGARMYVRVSGALTADLTVTKVSADYDKSINPLGGTAHISYTIENRGNLRIGGTATIAIAGPFGLAEKKVDLPDVPELLPGAKITLHADVDGVPELFYGSATLRLTPADGAGVSAAVSEASDSAFVPPLFVLIVLLVIVLGLIAWRTVRRRGGGHDDGATGEPDSSPDPDRKLEHQPA